MTALRKLFVGHQESERYAEFSAYLSLSYKIINTNLRSTMCCCVNSGIGTDI